MPTTKCGHCNAECYISEKNRDEGAEVYCSEVCAQRREDDKHPPTETDIQRFLASLDDRALVVAIVAIRECVKVTRDTLGHEFQVAAAMEEALINYIQSHNEDRR